MRIIYRDIVASLIVSKDNKIFMGMKDAQKGGVYSHCWHIPGGGVEEGETKSNALVREVREETGIDILNYEIYRKYYKEGVEGLKFIPKKYMAAIKTAADIDLWTIEQISKNPLVIYQRKVKPSNFTILRKGIGNFIAMQL